MSKTRSVEASAAKTVAGSTAILIILVNSVQHATGWYERWFALVLAVGIAAVGTFLINKEFVANIGTKLFTVIINGAMIYSAAFGVQNNVIAVDPPDKEIVVTEEVEIPRISPPPMAVPPRFELRERKIKIPGKIDTRQFDSPW